jgi:hypothetical protein
VYFRREPLSLAEKGTLMSEKETVATGDFSTCPMSNFLKWNAKEIPTVHGKTGKSMSDPFCIFKNYVSKRKDYKIKEIDWKSICANILLEFIDWNVIMIVWTNMRVFKSTFLSE